MRNLRRRKRRRSKNGTNVVQYSRKDERRRWRIVSATNAEGPPVPIPNTEVKLCSGENTLRETVREDSSVLTLTEESGEIRFPKVKNTKCESHTNHIGS